MKNIQWKNIFIYEKYKAICKNCEAFYSVEQEIDWYKIESFSYRLAAYSDFEKNDWSLDMRGIAFITWNEIKTPKLFTVWFHKFFNY